jgi:hypothetical protein
MIQSLPAHVNLRFMAFTQLCRQNPGRRRQIVPADAPAWLRGKQDLGYGEFHLQPVPAGAPAGLRGREDLENGRDNGTSLESLGSNVFQSSQHINLGVVGTPCPSSCVHGLRVPVLVQTKDTDVQRRFHK